MSKLLLAVAVLGLVVSGYLLVSYQSSSPTVCLVGHGCDEVRASSFSSILGVPTPLFGVVYYFGLGILAALWSSRQAQGLRWPLMILTGIGLAGSAWLTYLEAFVIKAWCNWCVASAILATVAFLLVWFKLYRINYYGNNQ